MADVVAANGREALLETAFTVMGRGELVSPRGQRTKEIEHFTVEIQDPRDMLCTGINAGQSTRVAAAETLQLLGGFSDADFAIKHAPALAAFTNMYGEFDGAYGPRLKTQYQPLLDRLTSDRDTRQAVLRIWDDHDLRRLGSKDYPCTLVLGFAIRRDRLNLSVVMRSNDVNWGFKNDIFQFSQLQLTLANVLHIEPGVYRHTAFSMHLYERDWQWAADLQEPAGEIHGHPQGLYGEDARDFMRLARNIAHGLIRTRHTDGFCTECDSSHWYADAIKEDA
jgi:thymidylate synthase